MNYQIRLTHVYGISKIISQSTGLAYYQLHRIFVDVDGKERDIPLDNYPTLLAAKLYINRIGG